jgi:hypothetical protein
MYKTSLKMINLDVKLLKNCVFVCFFVYLFVCVGTCSHVCMFSSDYAAACDFISFEWLEIFPSHIILSQMIL